mmetsp:Transcript_18456/g.27888  ORF Transcript_18456/g.27888 Transcript_18456/m.27888 type:complete len:147 (+) Transcript_18456:56-496(+)
MMSCERSQSIRQQKLIDYTQEGRADMGCNQGSPRAAMKNRSILSLHSPSIRNRSSHTKRVTFSLSKQDFSTLKQDELNRLRRLMIREIGRQLPARNLNLCLCRENGDRRLTHERRRSLNNARDRRSTKLPSLSQRLSSEETVIQRS